MTYKCPVCGSIVDKGNSLCSFCGALYQIESTGAVQTGATCFDCGHQAETILERCPECGAEYRVECPKCNHEYKAAPQLCPSCGFDNHAAYHEALNDQSCPRQRIIGVHPFYVVFRIALVLGVMGCLFFLFDQLNWEGPQALGGFFLVMAVISIVVVFVMYSSVLGKAQQTKKKRRPGTGQFALVYRTLNLPRAEHLRSFLESEGVPAFIYNRNATTLEPFDAFTGIKVMVPRDRLVQVEQLMNAFGFETDDI